MASVAVISLLISLSLLSASAVPEDELSSALSVMRSNGGYSLFANAVATSDLYYSLLLSADDSFTLFAPPDPSVFSLDMSAASADDYVSALRRHVVPRRLSLLTLRSAPSGSNLPTLEPRHSIHLQTRLDDDVISVDGIDVTSPGLFYSRSVAVHGLGGIILPRHHLPPLPPPQTPIPDLSIIVSQPPVPELSSVSQLPIFPPASSPSNVGSPTAIEVSPVSSITPVMAPYVEAPQQSTEREVSLSHVIVRRGNTFTLEPQPRLTCPLS